MTYSLFWSQPVDEFVTCSFFLWFGFCSRRENSKPTETRHYKPCENIQSAYWPDASRAGEQDKIQERCPNICIFLASDWDHVSGITVVTSSHTTHAKGENEPSKQTKPVFLRSINYYYFHFMISALLLTLEGKLRLNRWSQNVLSPRGLYFHCLMWFIDKINHCWTRKGKQMWLWCLHRGECTLTLPQLRHTCSDNTEKYFGGTNSLQINQPVHRLAHFKLCCFVTLQTRQLVFHRILYIEILL